MKQKVTFWLMMRLWDDSSPHESSMINQRYSKTWRRRCSKTSIQPKTFRNQRKINNLKNKNLSSKKEKLPCAEKQKLPLPHCCRHRENRVENYCDVDRTISTEEGCLTCTPRCQHKRELSKIESALLFKNALRDNLPIWIFQSPYFSMNYFSE